MTSVILLTARWCSICPSAKAFWSELRASEEFEYVEVDVESERGRELVDRHSVLSVPTAIINGRTILHGVPKYEEARHLVTPMKSTGRL